MVPVLSLQANRRKKWGVAVDFIGSKITGGWRLQQKKLKEGLPLEGNSMTNLDNMLEKAKTLFGLKRSVWS